MNLEGIRQRIDRLDLEIVDRLHLRAELALLARRFKESVVDEEREREVLEKVRRKGGKPVTPAFLDRLYRQIIEETRRIQYGELRLAGFQGEHGAFSEQALAVFAPALVPIPCLEFNDVFETVESGLFDCGLVPVENSLEGSVPEVNRILLETRLKIVGEVLLPIHHSLLSLAGTGIREIRAVYSHPQALAQCRNFLSRQALEVRAFYDTAGAARWLAAERPHDVGVIAGRLAAERYGLEIIKENVEDHPGNRTRFIVLSAQAGEDGGNKHSIVFTTPHRAGALSRILSIFAEERINLTRVESMPVRNNPEQWAFLLDFLSPGDEARVTKVMERAREEAASFRDLGSYKEASL